MRPLLPGIYPWVQTSKWLLPVRLKIIFRPCYKPSIPHDHQVVRWTMCRQLLHCDTIYSVLWLIKEKSGFACYMYIMFLFEYERVGT